MYIVLVFVDNSSKGMCICMYVPTERC